MIGREPDELRENGLAGTPEEIIDKLGRYGAMGVQRIYMQLLDLDDLDQVDLVGSQIIRG